VTRTLQLSATLGTFTRTPPSGARRKRRPLAVTVSAFAALVAFIALATVGGVRASARAHLGSPPPSTLVAALAPAEGETTEPRPSAALLTALAQDPPASRGPQRHRAPAPAPVVAASVAPEPAPPPPAPAPAPSATPDARPASLYVMPDARH